MSNRAIIATNDAPAAIGPYSQAVKVGNTVWISGQIPLDPHSMTVIDGDTGTQARQAFSNLTAIAQAAGGSLDDAVKINISLTDMNDFVEVNKVMEEFCNEPYPARACVQVAGLPKGVAVEIEAVLVL